MQNYGLHVEIPRKSGILRDTPLTALAFFLGPPQGWECSNWDDKIVKNFRTSLEVCPNLSSSKIAVHGCYLINPASTKDIVREKSKIRFLKEVKLCDTLNIGNYVFHPGTNKDIQKGLQKTVDLINMGLRETKYVNILVENMTKTNTLCQTWQEVEWVINHVENVTHPETGKLRVGNCLDTAHCWGAGEKKGMFMETLLDDYERIVGIDNLKVIHLNDSKVEYGSNKDRHEDILKGQIPKSFWNSFIFDERIKTIPAILETPSNCHPIISEIIRNKGVNCEKEEKKNNIINFFNSKSIPENKLEKTNSFIQNTKDSQNDKKISPYENLEDLIPECWNNIMKGEYEKSYFKLLKQKLLEEEKNNINIYPPINNIFRVFDICKPENIRVVICGQDPYHRKGQAEGFSFSVPNGVRIPSSLINIYKELSTDIENFKIPKHGNLIKWVEQGVFLLNSSLTVAEGNPGSHLKSGWQKFTTAVLKYINENCKNVVFMLWGNFAKEKCNFVDTNKHYILKAAHPSGLSANRGFYGCKHFSKCNEYLKSKNLIEINWQI